MQLNRVVITGMGAVSPFGCGVSRLCDALYSGASAVAFYPPAAEVRGLRCLVAAAVPPVDAAQIPRRFRRSMSAMSIYAVLAAGEALRQGRVDDELCRSGRLGVAVGSTVVSSAVSERFFGDYFPDNNIEKMKTTLFFQLMNHTCASNVAQSYAISGRQLAPAAACATGSQAIGFACEMIAAGRQDMMLCGGADELHPLTSATFDVMNAASTAYNDDPGQTPRPFAADRDGMVCGEGAGVVLLESLPSALRRGADILAEVVGFATASDTGSIANPDAAVMARCMTAALDDAGISAAQVDYVNAHATATESGDIAESQAIEQVFGSAMALSSLKGHIGHTLAACGALETIACVEMMRCGRLLPTLHLHQVDERCACLDYVRAVRERQAEIIVKNNFALGGVNTSLVLRRYHA